MRTIYTFTIQKSISSITAKNKCDVNDNVHMLYKGKNAEMI